MAEQKERRLAAGEPGESDGVRRLADALAQAEAVLVGAGSGLSTAAGLTYSGERFQALFPDFIAKYAFMDMYSAGFYPYPTPEERWAYWSRYILCNRFGPIPGGAYDDLRRLLDGKDAFVLTTNVDHCFQRAGFNRERLFYTQGDYGLWQCSEPCCQRTYDNEAAVRQMAAQQRDMRIPTELLPRCPVCGKPMRMNLRSDDRFVEDAGWHAAAARYEAFVQAHATGHVLYLELGVGGNTPGIIKYPFWRMAYANPDAVYACVNRGEAWAPREIADRSVCIDADIAAVLGALVR